MSAKSDESIREDARLWAIRVRDPAFARWDDFTVWLEADPARNAAYEAALDELADSDAIFDVAPSPTKNPAPAMKSPARRWAIPAIAACAAVLAVSSGWLPLDRSPMQEYATGPGERRSIALADGSRILLNGETRLRLNREDPREVEMVDGEALFEIRHDKARPFVVTMDDGTRLIDIGTVFNVIGRAGALDVAVAEGIVDYVAGDTKMRLDAGEMLTRPASGAVPVKRAVDPGVVGTWRAGYLHFGDANMRQVASDLSRNLGIAVEVEDTLATRRFSGTVMLDGGTDAVIARLEPLLGVDFERQGDGWRIIPADGSRR